MSASDQHEPDPDRVMRVDLDQLELGTAPLTIELSKAWIADALAETDAVVERGGVARLEVMLQADRTLLVRGRLELGFSVPCARCLEPAVVDVGLETGELCVTYVPADRLRSWPQFGAELGGAPEDEDEIEPLAPSELDELGYEGSIVDLRGLITEQLLLAYPMRALCSRQEACRGLCMRCGADLNASLESEGQGDGTEPERCSACGLRLDGIDDEADDTPWKRALSKLKS